MRKSLLLVALGVACGPDKAVPDDIYKVTVTGTENACTTDTSGYQESFNYELYYDGATVNIEIDGDSFASGTRAGCSIEYQSAIYLEERDGGDLQWQLVGSAERQGASGGCDIDGGFDWLGTETIEVIGSENESIEEGCTYTLSVEGSYEGSG